MKDNRIKNIIHLTKHLSGYSSVMTKSIVIGLIYKVLPVILSFLLSYAIGIYTSGNVLDNLPIYLIAVLVIIIFLAVGRYIDCIYSHDVAYRILADIRVKLFYKIEQLSPAFLGKSRSGNILSILMDDVNVLEWFYAHTFSIFFITLTVSLAVLTFLFSLHPLIAVVIIFWIIAIVISYNVLKKKSEKNGNTMRKNLGNLEAEITDGIHGIKDIVSLNYEKSYQEHITKVKTKYETSYFKESHRRGIEVSLNKTIISLATLSILVVTSYLIQSEQLGSEWYLVIVVISSAIWRPISELLNMVSNIGLISAAAGRVGDILEEEPQVKDSGDKELKLGDNYSIEYKNICFTYPSEQKPVLNDVSFTLNSGETVAISGVSGSGKSTLANLLLRFYEFESGEIMLNGENIRNFTLSSIRNEIAVVPQDIYLFNTSILENVKISNPNASKEQVINALKLSGADEFISELPDGYDTIVSERGSRFSGGQKQRIAIARAILKNSKILILDEASSNLDYSSEKHFNNSLSELKKGRSTIIIAHRLSMLKMADKIVFIKDGVVDAIGNFSELAEENSTFREMIGGLK